MAKETPKDLPHSHTECFSCNEKGHYSTSKECPLYKKEQEAEV